MITQIEKNKYELKCDGDKCFSKTNDYYLTFQSAVDARYKIGWLSTIVKGKWGDYCPKCWKKLIGEQKKD